MGGVSMGDTSPVNEATLELLKRQIADDVTSMVRARLFATYAVAGGAVLAVLGLMGHGAIGLVMEQVRQQIEHVVEAPAKAAVENAHKALTNVEASRLTLENLQNRSF